MTKPRTLYVEAQPGRTVPFHPSSLSAPGGRGGLLKPGECAEVKNTMEVRRAIRSGDLKIISKPVHAGDKPAAKPAAKE